MTTAQSRRDVVLAALPGNLRSVAEATGLGRTTVWRWLKDIHGAGESHVTGWDRVDGGGPFLPTYTAGPGIDVECRLKPMTQAQKSRRHMRKAIADGRWDDRMARERAKHWANRAKTHPDPLVALFFGMGAARPAN